VEPCDRHLILRHRGEVVAETRRSLRVLETSHPPTYYFPPEDVRAALRLRRDTHTFCEWKGQADYYDVDVAGELIERAAWCYPSPTEEFAAIRDFLSFYAHPFDECLVDGEPVDAQQGRFYGGWITSNIVGPFKGGPQTAGW
jgi:uncharacterized protein (DUF427 family)